MWCRWRRWSTMSKGWPLRTACSCLLDERLLPEQAFSGRLKEELLPPEVRQLIPDVDDFVVGRPVADETSYAVVLHELGHILSPLGRIKSKVPVAKGWDATHPRERHRQAGLLLDQEYAAWEWAEYNALCWTPAMEQVKLYALGTYEQYRKEVR